MIAECCQGDSTRSVLGFVRFKIAISNLYAKVKNEARNSAEDK